MEAGGRRSGGRCAAGRRRLCVAGGRSRTEIPVDDVPEAVDVETEPVEIIGPRRPVDVVASEAGTIAYEILARISHRIRRVYIDEVGGE